MYSQTPSASGEARHSNAIIHNLFLFTHLKPIQIGGARNSVEENSQNKHIQGIRTALSDFTSFVMSAIKSFPSLLWWPPHSTLLPAPEDFYLPAHTLSRHHFCRRCHNLAGRSTGCISSENITQHSEDNIHQRHRAFANSAFLSAGDASPFQLLRRLAVTWAASSVSLSWFFSLEFRQMRTL